MFNLKLQQIEAFIKVAEKLNLTKAAGDMYVTPSALSKIMRKFENELDARLFERSNSGVSLTPEGKHLYEELKTPYTAICRTLEETRSAAGAPRRALRVGFPGTYDIGAGCGKLKGCISAYAAEHGEMELTEFLYDFTEIGAAVLRGEIDVAFTPDFTLMQFGGIANRRLSKCEMCLVLPASHPMSRTPLMDMSELNGDTFLILDFKDDADSAVSAEKLIAKYGVIPGMLRLAPNFQSMLRMVRQGKGIALCSYYPQDPSDDDGLVFHRLPESSDPQYYMAAWREDEFSDDIKQLVNAVFSKLNR